MKLFWQDKRHGTLVKGAAAEGLAATSGRCEDDLRELEHKLKELHINVENYQARQQKDTASFQGVVRRIEAKQGRHTARLDQVDDHQELHAEQVNHGSIKCDPLTEVNDIIVVASGDSINSPNLIYKSIIVTYKAHTDGESSSNQTNPYLLNPIIDCTSSPSNSELHREYILSPTFYILQSLSSLN